MTLPENKTKIVCTIGPASSSIDIMKEMILAGMNVARLNFSHGDFGKHKEVIENLREASKSTGKEVAIMADLPGPKMRIGQLTDEPIELQKGNPYTLTTKTIRGDNEKASVSFARLPLVVKQGDSLFLNDGIIQLEVKKVIGDDVLCDVVVGGELRSRKGLNLPGIELGMSAFTDKDREILQFALQNGVDGISQSFVDSARDIQEVRETAKDFGYSPFIIAKIERSKAVERYDEILKATDGIMVARGDLGVETPFERMAVLQKDLIRRAMIQAKPVITATQMLESMTTNRQPTRAEATDVANAILDGTDCVMLSGESAMGKNPIEAVRTLARIGAATEPHSTHHEFWENMKRKTPRRPLPTRDLLSLSLETMMGWSDTGAVVVPTQSGSTARSITRFRLPVWVVAPTPDEKVSRQLNFSYGVISECVSDPSQNWVEFAQKWIQSRGLPRKLGVLVQGPSEKNPERNYMMEFIELN